MIAGDICCGTCGGPEPSTAEPTTVVTTTPMTAPPNCEDTLQQCDMLTANLFNCYAVSTGRPVWRPHQG